MERSWSALRKHDQCRDACECVPMSVMGLESVKTKRDCARESRRACECESECEREGARASAWMCVRARAS
eukprot:5855546-Pleurochrysis_carterae.AAC.1